MIYELFVKTVGVIAVWTLVLGLSAVIIWSIGDLKR